MPKDDVLLAKDKSSKMKSSKRSKKDKHHRSPSSSSSSDDDSSIIILSKEKSGKHSKKSKSDKSEKKRDKKDKKEKSVVAAAASSSAVVVSSSQGATELKDDDDESSSRLRREKSSSKKSKHHSNEDKKKEKEKKSKDKKEKSGKHHRKRDYDDDSTDDEHEHSRSQSKRGTTATATAAGRGWSPPTPNNGTATKKSKRDKEKSSKKSKKSRAHFSSSDSDSIVIIDDDKPKKSKSDKKEKSKRSKRSKSSDDERSIELRKSKREKSSRRHDDDEDRDKMKKSKRSKHVRSNSSSQDLSIDSDKHAKRSKSEKRSKHDRKEDKKEKSKRDKEDKKEKSSKRIRSVSSTSSSASDVVVLGAAASGSGSKHHHRPDNDDSHSPKGKSSNTTAPPSPARKHDDSNEASKKSKKDKKKEKKKSKKAKKSKSNANFDDSDSSSSSSSGSSSTESDTPVQTKVSPWTPSSPAPPQRMASSATLTDYHKIHPKLSPSGDDVPLPQGFVYNAPPLECSVRDLLPSDGVLSPRLNNASSGDFTMGGHVPLERLRSVGNFGSSILASNDFNTGNSPTLSRSPGLGASYGGSPGQMIPLLDSAHLAPGMLGGAIAAQKKFLGERLLAASSVWDQPFDVTGLLHYTSAMVSSYSSARNRQATSAYAGGAISSPRGGASPQIENLLPPRLLPPPPPCRAIPVCGTLRCHVTRSEFGEADYNLDDMLDPLVVDEESSELLRKNKKQGVFSKILDRVVKPNEGVKFKLFTDAAIDSFIPRGVLVDGEKASAGVGCGVCHGAVDQWRAGSWGNRSTFLSNADAAMKNSVNVAKQEDTSTSEIPVLGGGGGSSSAGSPTTNNTSQLPLGSSINQQHRGSVVAAKIGGGDGGSLGNSQGLDDDVSGNVGGVNQQQPQHECMRRFLLSSRRRAHKRTPNFIITAQPQRTLAVVNDPRSVAGFGTIDMKSMIDTRPGLTKSFVTSMFTSTFTAHVHSPCGYVDRHLRHTSVSELASTATIPISKMRGNFAGTNFVIYDDGLNPEELKKELRSWVRAVEKAGKPFTRKDEKKSAKKLKKIGLEAPLISTSAKPSAPPRESPLSPTGGDSSTSSSKKCVPTNLEEARKAALEGWTKTESGDKVYALPLAPPPRLRCEIGAIHYRTDSEAKAKPYRCQRVLLPAVDPENGTCNSFEPPSTGGGSGGGSSGSSASWFQESFLTAAITNAGGRDRVNAAYTKYWKGNLTETTPDAEKLKSKTKKDTKRKSSSSNNNNNNNNHPPQPRQFAQEVDAQEVAPTNEGTGVKGFFSRLFTSKKSSTSPVVVQPSTSKRKHHPHGGGGGASVSSSSDTSSDSDDTGASSDGSRDGDDGEGIITDGAVGNTAIASGVSKKSAVFSVMLHTFDKHQVEFKRVKAELISEIEADKAFYEGRRKHLAKERDRHLKARSKRLKTEKKNSEKKKKDADKKEKKEKKHNKEKNEETSKSTKEKKKDKKKREASSSSSSRSSSKSSSDSEDDIPSYLSESTTLQEFCDLGVEDILYGKVLSRRRAPDGTSVNTWRRETPPTTTTTNSGSNNNNVNPDADPVHKNPFSSSTNTPPASSGEGGGGGGGKASHSFLGLVARGPFKPNCLNPLRPHGLPIPGAGIRQTPIVFDESEALYEGGIMTKSLSWLQCLQATDTRTIHAIEYSTSAPSTPKKKYDKSGGVDALVAYRVASKALKKNGVSRRQCYSERLPLPYPKGMLVFVSKEPVANEKKNSYTLNFGGRAPVPSLKNFQLVQVGAGDGQDARHYLLRHTVPVSLLTAQNVDAIAAARANNHKVDAAPTTVPLVVTAGWSDDEVEWFEEDVHEGRHTTGIATDTDEPARRVSIRRKSHEKQKKSKKDKKKSKKDKHGKKNKKKKKTLDSPKSFSDAESSSGSSTSFSSSSSKQQPQCRIGMSDVQIRRAFQKLHPLLRIRIPVTLISSIYVRAEINSLGCRRYGFGVHHNGRKPSSASADVLSAAAKMKVIRSSIDSSSVLLDQLGRAVEEEAPRLRSGRSHAEVTFVRDRTEWQHIPRNIADNTQDALAETQDLHPAIAAYEAGALQRAAGPTRSHVLLQGHSAPRASSLLLDPDRIVLLFGRRSHGAFSLDFEAPINSVQALCIALSSFDSKF